MSTLTIEVPDALTAQIQNKRISKQQLETMFVRVLQRYLEAPQLKPERPSFRSPTTLRDLRGSIPVSAPQDFDAIRQQVISTRIQQRMSYGA